MIEAGVVLDINGGPIYWHLPKGRTGGSIPDSQVLWEVLWDNREILGGFAHSHPGSGPPTPSMTDLTTFVAIEAALGRRIDWWITSSDRLLVCNWSSNGLPPYGMHSYTSKGGVKHSYLGVVVMNEPSWVNDLRKISEG